MTREQRFWAKVKKTPTCWLWTANTVKGGYGLFVVDGRTNEKVMAHRFSWELANGPIPSGRQACHSCDTPACVRPDHLFLGTQSENLLDCSAKGRIARGERNGNRQLSEADVVTIRRRYIPRRPSNARPLAAEFHVAPSTIRRIARRIWDEVYGLGAVEIRAIRARFDPGTTGNHRELATEFGVHRTTILNVVKRDWRHVA